MRRAWEILFGVVGGDIGENLPHDRFPNGKEPDGDLLRLGQVDREGTFLDGFLDESRLNAKEQRRAEINEFWRCVDESNGEFIPHGHPHSRHRGDIKRLVLLHLCGNPFRNFHVIGEFCLALSDRPRDEGDSTFRTIFLNVLDRHDDGIVIPITSKSTQEIVQMLLVLRNDVLRIFPSIADGAVVVLGRRVDPQGGWLCPDIRSKAVKDESFGAFVLPEKIAQVRPFKVHLAARNAEDTGPVMLLQADPKTPSQLSVFVTPGLGRYVPTATLEFLLIGLRQDLLEEEIRFVRFQIEAALSDPSN